MKPATKRLRGFLVELLRRRNLLPKRVLIDEEGPREGFQSEKKTIPVARARFA